MKNNELLIDNEKLKQEDTNNQKRFDYNSVNKEKKKNLRERLIERKN